MFVYKTERSSNATMARVLSKINPDEYEIILLNLFKCTFIICSLI